MSNSQRLTFGIKTSPQFTTYDDILPVWLEADKQPLLEHAWVNDHFIPISTYVDATAQAAPVPVLESWSVLSALAARTERLRLGVMVTGNTYRHPAVLAKIAATVDHIAHGRLDFGIGAGWFAAEHEMYGIPLPPPGERIRRFGEACEVIRLLWSEPVSTFHGEFYTLQDAVCDPKPVQQPYPPFMIGGGGEQRTLRVVAQYADIWNFEVPLPEMSTAAPLERFIHKNAVLDRHCAAIGRNPAEIVRSVQILADPENLEGTRQMLDGFITAGMSHIVLMLRPPYPAEIVQRLAEEIAQPLVESQTS